MENLLAFLNTFGLGFDGSSPFIVILASLVIIHASNIIRGLKNSGKIILAGGAAKAGSDLYDAGKEAFKEIIKESKKENSNGGGDSSKGNGSKSSEGKKEIKIKIKKIKILFLFFFAKKKNNIISGDKITSSFLESFLPKFKESGGFLNSNLLEYNKKINLVFNKDKEFIVDSKSKIISSLEKNNSKTLSEIFQSKEDFNLNVDPSTIINSPLESNLLDKLNDIKDLVVLLNYNLILNMIMLYFIFSLFVIFTFKIITDKNINLDFIKNYPLGKIIYFILSFLINS